MVCVDMAKQYQRDFDFQSINRMGGLGSHSGYMPAALVQVKV